MTSLLPDAVRAQQRGFHIFPCNEAGSLDGFGEPADKRPHYTSRPYTLKWGEAATNDINKIVGWWTRWPQANIGVACRPSGLLVVDCDRAKSPNALKGTRWEYLHEICGPMVDGEVVFDQVCERYGKTEIPDTLSVATGSGGVHYYYRWPDGIRASQASIVRGVLDIRCNGGERGGYVLGAGSVTAQGVYRTLRDPGAIRDAPNWLVHLCREKEKPQRPAYERGGSANYSGLVNSVAYAPEGNRNQCLYWAAYAMADDGATEEEAQDTLGEAAALAGLSAKEALDTIRSGFRAQARNR